MKHIAKKPLKPYDTDKLQGKETSKKFASIIGEGFANLLDDEMTPDEFYIRFKKIVHTSAEKEIGYKRHNEIPGLSSEVKDLCAQRRSAKIMMLQNQFNEEYTNRDYRELNKRVKAEVKKQKNNNLSEKYLKWKTILKRITHINYSNKFVN